MEAVTLATGDINISKVMDDDVALDVHATFVTVRKLGLPGARNFFQR